MFFMFIFPIKHLHHTQVIFPFFNLNFFHFSYTIFMMMMMMLELHMNIFKLSFIPTNKDVTYVILLLFFCLIFYSFYSKTVCIIVVGSCSIIVILQEASTHNLIILNAIKIKITIYIEYIFKLNTNNNYLYFFSLKIY